VSITTKLIISQTETDLISTQTEKAVNPAVLYKGPETRTLVAAAELALNLPVGGSVFGVVLSAWGMGDLTVYGVTGGQASGLVLPSWTYAYLPMVIPVYGLTNIYLYSATGGTVVVRMV
jgi:hypothetical protein